jgi:DNA repair photolyase
VIPVLTDPELETIVSEVATAGAKQVHYILLRLPREVADLFEEWLYAYVPNQAAHIMNRVMDSRDGKKNDPRFGHRLRGHGFYADMIRQRFKNIIKQKQLNKATVPLNTELFNASPEQFDLF